MRKIIYPLLGALLFLGGALVGRYAFVKSPGSIDSKLSPNTDYIDHQEKEIPGDLRQKIISDISEMYEWKDECVNVSPKGMEFTSYGIDLNEDKVE